MRKLLVLISLVFSVSVSVSFTGNRPATADLRKQYSRPPDKWPAPFVAPGVKWKELGELPLSPLLLHSDSLKHLIELGKTLFFDPRLSSSEKISCATCHQPELSWTDGKERSIGHAGAINKRNSPTIQNSWFYQKLFWDGRARDLEDQAFAPINSESEMHGDMRELPRNLRKIKGYIALFDSAFDDPGIDPDRIATAIATFERTVISPRTKFDEFVSGKRNILTNAELRGLHLFRTKAKCMNCHNGPLFTDNQFHNNGFHLNGNAENDKGLYNVSHKEEDLGKFKTPSLRDVMKTGPWMHNGMMTHINDIIVHYNKTSPRPGRTTTEMLYLSNKEMADLISFLHTISASPPAFKRPVLPE
ncbi:MAG: c-type cytochrome [Chitinophagaceae bacterium]|nr:c-type cytochrome [Chitinophagaceae bacterium]